MDMQLKVHLSEGELADVGASLHVVASGDQLIEELFWNRLTRFVVAGDTVKAFAFPAPVFHDLRGKLNKVPGDVDTIE